MRARRPPRSERAHAAGAKQQPPAACTLVVLVRFDRRLARGCDTPQLEFPFARSDCCCRTRTLVEDALSSPDPDAPPAPIPTPTLWFSPWMLVVAVVGRRIVASYCVVSYCLCASTLVYNSIPISAYLPGISVASFSAPSTLEIQASLKTLRNLRQGVTGQRPGVE